MSLLMNVANHASRWGAKSESDDFFWWGYLESKMHASNPSTIDELKESNRAEIITMPFENIMENTAP